MDEEKIYIIPKNYDGGFVTGNGKGINHLIEAAIAAAIVVVPVMLSGLDIKYKMLVTILLGVPIFALIFRGKNGCLMSEYFLDYMRFKRSCNEIVSRPAFKHDDEN